MPAPSRPHGSGLRGLNLDRNSPLFAGAFGRMFRALPPADFGESDQDSQDALALLGAAITAGADGPKDGNDPEESGIPAAYTYFGQFIDHDLTFDPASSLQRQDDPSGLVDFRTPRFDLDSVYGRGPADQPYLYDKDQKRFLLGTELTGTKLGVAIENAHDLPRSSSDPARAIIGDPRNDENVIVSQLQGLMLRFHNRISTEHGDWSFEKVQQQVRFHYQWVVLYDFLRKVVQEAVLDTIVPLPVPDAGAPLAPPRLRFFHFRDDPFIPLEFAVAAYRFGHSMVRPGYRLNDDVGPLPIFDPNDDFGKALTGFSSFPPGWAIDWARFIDLEPRPFGDPNRPGVPGKSGDPDNEKRLQLAYRIDTSLTDPLATLPPRVAGDPPPNLAARNLLRGWRLRLPSGQDVAQAMGVVPLEQKDIQIGKFTGDAADLQGDIIGAVQKAAADANKPELAHLADGFVENCPLWVYVLAETRQNPTKVKVTVEGGTKDIDTYQLGDVGGRIVAETFAGLMAGDSSSFLNIDPRWRPDPAFTRDDGTFGLRELIAAALFT